MLGDQTIQSDQYEFPYHHLVDVRQSPPLIRRQLGWGFEYALYQTFVRDRIIERGYKSVLDIGCGDGWMVKELHRNKIKAAGIDTDPRAIQLAQTLCPDAELIAGSALNLDRQFEAVTLLEVLEHIPAGPECEILKKAWDLVSPGGSLFVTVPSTARAVHKEHFRHYNRQTLEELLRDAGVEGEQIELRYLCKDTALYRSFLKLTNNRRFSLQIPALDRFVWKRYRRDSLKADERNGLHIYFSARKKS